MAIKLNVILASFLLVNITFTASAQTLIPESEAEVDTWFQSVIKPIR